MTRLATSGMEVTGGWAAWASAARRSGSAGVLELPSGRVEAGEHLAEALARGVAEETALTVTGVNA